jgi:Asp-tRNA(Asn)/Glu-tRNA(Gln) amidotransferase A subunit family amidase
MYSRRTVRRRSAGTPWSASSSVFHPKPAPSVTRPPERWSTVAIVFARVIGSDSTGSATAVASRMREVTLAAVASDTHGSRVRV